MNSKSASFLALLFGFLLSTAMASPAFANDWNSVPELERREHLAIRAGFDGPRYNSARACLRRFNSLVDAEYFGVLVAVTDPSGSRSRDHDDATEYAAFVAEQWEDEGRFDPEKDVLIAIGVSNRSSGVFVGQRWRHLGLDEADIADMLTASHLSRYLARREYDEAFCSLATAIDHRLGVLEQWGQRQLQSAEELFPTAKERFVAVRTTVEESLPDENELRASLLEKLASRDSLLDADEEIEEAPAEVIAAAASLQEISDEVETQLEHYLERISPLDELEKEIAAVLTSIDDRADSGWEGAVTAREILEECQQRTAHARRSEQPDLLEIQDCLHRAEVELARSEERHFYVASALPRGILALLILLVAALVITRFLRRRRALKVLRPDLESWENGLSRAGKKLQSLREDFSWYFRDRSKFWEGENAAIDRSIADGINRAFLLLARGREILEEATSLHRRSRLLNVGKLDKALSRLRHTPVELQSGTAETQRPLQLPLSRRFETKSSQLLNEILTAYFEALEGLDQVASVQGQLATLLDKADRAHQQAREAIEERQRRGLPTSHLERRLDTAKQKWSQAAKSAEEIPEQGARGLEVAVDELETVQVLAEAGNRALDVVANQIAELRQQISNYLRAAQRGGIEFGDDGFEPERLADSAEKRAEEIVGLVSDGREEEAVQKLDPLVEELEQTSHRLSVCLEAPKLVPSVVESLQAVAPEFKEPLFQARMRLQRLAKNGEEEVADHFIEDVNRLQKIAPRLERLIKRISKAQDKGKSLRAVADLSPVVDAMATGAQNLATIQKFLNQPDDGKSPAPPVDPIWKPPSVWRDHPAAAWGHSEDAENFRSISLFGKKGSSTNKSPLKAH